MSVMVEPFWKIFHKATRCPDRNKRGSHPKCCAACPYPAILCGQPIECGEKCFLPMKHEGPCLCIGDEDGQPNSCPA